MVNFGLFYVLFVVFARVDALTRYFGSSHCFLLASRAYMMQLMVL